MFNGMGVCMKKNMYALLLFSFVALSGGCQLLAQEELIEIVQRCCCGSLKSDCCCDAAIMDCSCECGIQRSLAHCDKHEEVLNLNNSPLYAAIMAADDVFETTYVAQPDMYAPRKAAI